MSVWGKRFGLLVVFVWFLAGGVGHFLNTAFFVQIVPPYVPWPLAAVYVSGAFELLGAFGILVPRLRQTAGNGLFALTIAVTPANVYMWQHPDLFPGVSPNALSMRLILQVMLLVCIWVSTRTPAQPALPTASHPGGADPSGAG